MANTLKLVIKKIKYVVFRHMYIEKKLLRLFQGLGCLFTIANHSLINVLSNSDRAADVPSKFFDLQE